MPTAGEVIRRTALLPHAAFAVLFATLPLYFATGDAALRNGIQFTAVALMALRAASSGRPGSPGRCSPPPTCCGRSGTPARSSSTRCYLISYVAAHGGLVCLVAAQARIRWRTALALDGVLAGLTAAAILTSFVSSAFVGTGVRVPATALAGDAMLVTTIVCAFALSGWRPARAWWLDRDRRGDPRLARPLRDQLRATRRR